MDHNNSPLNQNVLSPPQSQLFQPSIPHYQKITLQNYKQPLQNTTQPMLSFLVQTQLDDSIQDQENGSMICNKESVLLDEGSLWGIDLESQTGKYPWYIDSDQDIPSQQDCLHQKSNLSKAQNYVTRLKTYQSAIKSPLSCDSSDSDDVFSEKLSLIRNLQQKLSSLQDKLKLPSSPVNYFDECKRSLEKDYQTYTQSTFTEKHEKDNCSTVESSPVNQLSQISRTMSEKKSWSKNFGNESIESESMLLDKDYEQFCTVKEVPSSQFFGLSVMQKPEIQIIETIRIVEVPYLIEVNREIEDTIVSKKSFYFEENEDVHRAFQEFTEKQTLEKSVSFQKDTSFKNESLNKSNCEVSRYKKCQNPFQNPENSILSVNDESNRTFHNELRQKREEISFNYEGGNSRILSKLQSKANHTQISELEDKLRALEIENLQLKEKVRQFRNDKAQMEVERLELAQELIRLSESEEMYEIKLDKYKATLHKVHGQFDQIIQIEQSKIRQQYEKQIEHFENEQSEYANRIIKFEELFEEQKQKEQKLTQIIESQSEQIFEFQRVFKEKDAQIYNETAKRNQLEEYVVERERELKSVIETLEKDKTELNHLLHQLQLRYESEGFYILNEEAQELRKALEQKDVNHVEELDKLENRYSDLIEKYQNQLENMKKGLEKVRLNRSSSFSNVSNYTNPNFVHYYPKVSQHTIAMKKRQSIFMSKLPKHFETSSNNVEIQNYCNFSIDNAPQFEKDISVSHFSMKSSVSQSQPSSLRVSPSQIEANHTQQLLILQVENLKYQNEKLQETLNSEREEKQTLSKKLSMIDSTMGKYLETLESTELQQQKNDETFTRCVEELEHQFLINKKLKEKISQLQSKSLDRTNTTELSGISGISINQEQVKVHPIYIQLSNKYRCSKKHIKALEKQCQRLVEINQQLETV